MPKASPVDLPRLALGKPQQQQQSLEGARMCVYLAPESDQIAPQRGRESDHRWSAGIHLKYVSVTITGYILEKPSKRTPLTL